MDYVDEAIAFALAGRVKESEPYLAWSKGIGARAANLPTQATGDLRGFRSRDRVYPGNGAQVRVLEPVSYAPAAVTLLANDAWRWISGLEAERRARGIIEAARVEYTRARFHWLLWCLGMTGQKQFDPAFSLRADDVRNVLLNITWSDADTVARTPTTDGYWASESNAWQFSDWCANCTEGALDYQARPPASLVQPSVSVASMSAGMALTWIDEAVCNAGEGAALLAEAAQALHESGFSSGWDSHEEMVAQDASHAARERAKRRHEPHRRMREKAIEHYLYGNFQSKDAAAAEIAGKVVPAAFRTVRSWLTGDLRSAAHGDRPEE